MEHLSGDNGARSSREGWLEAAYEILIESGVDSVKILPMAKKLNTARTSFYWFFKDRETLLEALIGRWRDLNTGNIVKQSEAYAESIAEAMLNVIDCWLDSKLFDAQFEFAVRSWALQSEDILSEVQNADDTRLRALEKMFIRFGCEDITADVRARTTYMAQIGYISMQTSEDLAVRMARIREYVTIFTGQAPQQRELDRFFARHNYST